MRYEVNFQCVYIYKTESAIWMEMVDLNIYFPAVWYAQFSIWSCSFVMYEAYFPCDLKRNPLSETVQSKIRGIFNVLRTWDYSHFLTHIFGKLKGNYLTQEIGKRTLTINHWPIPPPLIMVLKTDFYIKWQVQLSANVYKSYC